MVYNLKVSTQCFAAVTKTNQLVLIRICGEVIENTVSIIVPYIKRLHTTTLVSSMLGQGKKCPHSWCRVTVSAIRAKLSGENLPSYLQQLYAAASTEGSIPGHRLTCMVGGPKPVDCCLSCCQLRMRKRAQPTLASETCFLKTVQVLLPVLQVWRAAPWPAQDLIPANAGTATAQGTGLALALQLCLYKSMGRVGWEPTPS